MYEARYVYRSMEELSLKRSAIDQLGVLNPVNAAINRHQADNCLLGDVFELRWNPDEYQEDVAKRSLQALREVFLAANLLDPRYQGKTCALQMCSLLPNTSRKSIPTRGRVDEISCKSSPLLEVGLWRCLDNHVEIRSTGGLQREVC